MVDPIEGPRYSARTRAALAVDAEAIRLYHGIGLELLVRRNDATWGDKVLDTLSRDLRAAFPDMKGFSVRNLKYMSISRKNAPMAQLGSSLLPNCLGSTLSLC